MWKKQIAVRDGGRVAGFELSVNEEQTYCAEVTKVFDLIDRITLSHIG